MPTQPYLNAKGERVPGVTTVIGANLGWNKDAQRPRKRVCMGKVIAG